jgi:uncharacterized pyridoxal phosphate-containing UPF0001 family protein
MSEIDVRANLEAVRERIATAARRSGRVEDAVLLVAVSKTVPVERIREALAAGVTALGENRVQEAREKVAAIGRGRTALEFMAEVGCPPWRFGVPLSPSMAAWHLIGHLQTNKVRDAVDTFDVIQSVDRLALAEALSRRAVQAGRRLDVLVQVNVGDEPQKGGVAPDALRPALEAMGVLPGLRLCGLMAIPPFPKDPEDSRPYYRQMQALLHAAQGWGMGPDFRELSMGMSGDFEVGIEEGATIVRVGTAVFGARDHGGA